MLINELNFYHTNSFEECREDDNAKYESSFPLFNISALRDSELNISNYDYIFDAEKISEIVEEITTKKAKTNSGTEIVLKKRGRKTVDKNGKSWDDPTITMKEIIENDLAGEATASELKAKEERLRKMREAKALKRQRRLNGESTEGSDNGNEKIVEINLDAAEQSFAPQLIIKDGKIVVDNSYLNVQETKTQLVLADGGKPKKLTSMSFRTKNHTSKWTEEETRKFYKAIEIFGADFSMIAKLFQTRNRDQVKNKYNKESKVNGKMLDEAFKKNTLLCKRSIMDRIKLFNENVKNVENGNLDLEVVSLERNASNSSTDSLDLKVLNEIQDIFVKEIKSEKAKNNNNMNSFNLFNGTTFALNNNFLNEETNTKEVQVVNNNVNTINEEANKEVAVAVTKKKNLLLGF